MSCNWELFEFRVIVMYKLVAQSGARFVGLGSTFWEVLPDLRTLGIADFQGSNDYCNFKAVFNQLVKLKRIHFSCPQKSNTGNHFSRLQAADKAKEHLPIAKLFVHRRDEPDVQSDIAGPAIILEGVDVLFTGIQQDVLYAQLSGDKARGAN